MGKGSSAPSYPDPVATAEAQGAANKEAAQESAYLSRLNQITPYGNIKYDYGNIPGIEQYGGTPATQYQIGGQTFSDLAQAQQYARNAKLDSSGVQTIQTTTGGGYKVGDKNFDNYQDALNYQKELQLAINPTLVTELSPEQQQLYNLQTQIGLGLGGLGQTFMGQIPTEALSLESATPLIGTDLRNQYTQQAYDRSMGLLEPQFQKQRGALEDKLIQQGIPIGSEAWNSAVSDFEENTNEARRLAALDAITSGEQMYSSDYGRSLTSRQQDISDILLQRTQPMNELAAILQGSPAVSTPYSTSTGSVGYNAGDVAGQYANQYQSQLANWQAQQQQASSINNLLGTGAMAAAMYFSPVSDRRLKKNIKFLKKIKDVKFYEFEYNKDWLPKGVHFGVMAQEVKNKIKDSVFKMSNGFYAVNYNKVIEYLGG